jgi:hypothetical protein
VWVVDSCAGAHDVDVLEFLDRGGEHTG